MKRLFLLIASACILFAGCGEKGYKTDLREVAVKVSEQGLSRTDLGHYMGTCLYHGMADLALATNNKEDMDRVMSILLRIKSGEIPIHYRTFIDYEVGGQAAALLACKGQTELVDEVKACAAKMWAEQPRTEGNMMTSASYAPHNAYWIDIAFTVSPFFLYAGLLENNQEYIDYAAFYALQCARDLYDPATDLYHQGYNHANRRPGISDDNWSRGNGWMSMALGALLRDYPRNGKYWNDIVKESERFYSAVCRVQDENGMWHQEMGDLTSYPETSGSGQVLAGLGAAIEAGVLDKAKFLPYFKKGVKGLLGYVDPDGSVGHCCMGNCVPGTGRKEDFLPVHWYYNENHCSGPIVLALAQAIKLGIKSVVLDAPIGSANDADRPRAYARVITERKNDVAWENDRMAFRVYSQVVANKAASGVDLWPKSVDYSIIDEWYAKESKGLSYHKDTGTGCDCYNMGTGRGIGGTGIWDGANLVCSEVYDKVEMINQGPEKLEFTLGYKPFEVAGKTITESKRIEMKCLTSFYKVTDVITTSDGSDAILAVGISSFGAPIVTAAPEAGKLFVSEEFTHKEPVGIGMHNNHPRLNSWISGAVVADPSIVAGIVEKDGDQLLLIKVKSGQPVVFYVGADWDHQQNSGRWGGGKGFWKKTFNETTWSGLNEFYK